MRTIKQFIRRVKRTYALLLGIIMVLGFSIFGCTGCAPEEMIIAEDFPPSYYESKKTVSAGMPINLSALDSVRSIYYWEVINDTLRIITVEDEIENELKRLEYIKETFYE